MSSVQVIEPQFHKVVGETPGVEGPVFTRSGKLYCVSAYKKVEGKQAGEIVSVDLEAKTKTTVGAPKFDGHGGMPAGMQSDKENNLWVTDMFHGLLKVTPDGNISQVARVDDEGDAMQGCNDCIFDYDGNLWVAAPAGDIAPAVFKYSFEEALGSVYCMKKTGGITKVDTGYWFPNGIAVQHDTEGTPKKLIVGETKTQSLWSYDILGPAAVENKQLWGKLPVAESFPESPFKFNGPDGMDFDEAGNLLVANWNASHIEVFGPTGGEPLARIKTPFIQPTNVHFKPNSNICYVTEHSTNSLWWFEWRHGGRKEYCEL